MAAEMVATLYDASLDAFRSNTWNFSPWKSRYNTFSWSGDAAFSKVNASLFRRNWNRFKAYQNLKYDRLNWFGWNAWDPYNYTFYNEFDGDSEHGALELELRLGRSLLA